MNKAKYYHVSDTGLSEGVSLGRITVVLGADFDTAQSELAALREAYVAAGEREHALREELAKYKGGCIDLSSQVRELEHKMDFWKGEGKRADAAEQRNAELVRLIQAALDGFNAEGIESFDSEMYALEAALGFYAAIDKVKEPNQ